ncbi:MAG: D-Ala-D-Ala carboxypeptidase family metallohydrolase [Kofleriaceae bacterium]|nr:D-Ala-D-Ala carboxypeptidase family metallohydrolase [Kofleriaceae bacterium]
MTPPPRITLADYFMGRDDDFPDELTEQIRVNAAVTVERVNQMLEVYAKATGDARRRKVNSGWRPLAINMRVRGSAMRSKHLSGEACDLDDLDGSLDRWAGSKPGLDELARIGLWLEHPDATPTWCHVQTVPPGSGNRVFRP